MNILEYLRQEKPPVFTLPVDGKSVKKFFEVPELLFVRGFMDPVYGRQFFPEKIVCHCLVRGDHEFFDDLVREESLRTEDVLDAAFDIEDYLRLGEVEIEGTPLCPLFPEGCLLYTSDAADE